MKSGIELIAEERQDQIRKHGYITTWDINENSEGQLSHAARKLISPAVEREVGCPKNWKQDAYNKMADKSYLDRLIIAGALIAAEIDRLQIIDGSKHVNS